VTSTNGNDQAGTEHRGLDEEQDVLSRVAALVGRVAQPDQLFAAVVEEVGRLLHVDFVVLGRHERQDTQVSVGAWSRAGLDTPFPVGTRVRLGGDDVVSLVMKDGRPARRDDYADSGEVAEAARGWGMHSAVGVPVSVAGRLWGVMTVASGKPEPLPPETEQRLAGFTELVAAAVANADARRELYSHAEEEAALRRIATLVVSGAPSEDVFAAVTAEAGRLLAVDVAALVRYDPEDTVAIVGTWTITGDAAPTPVGARLPLGGRNVTTLVFETGQPARIEYDDVSGPIGTAASRDWRLRLSLGVPIKVEGRLWGVMVVAFTREGVLPGDAEARLAGFTELVATGIANAQAREDLHQLVEEQAALRRVATLVAQGEPPAEIFAIVGQEVGRLFGSAHAAVAKFDPDGQSLVVVGVARKMNEVPVGARYKLDERMAATAVYRTGRSARVESADWSGDAPISETARRFGTVSSVASPIIVDGRLWGSIIVTASELLPTNTPARLKRFTELVATAISNAQARTELRSFADEQAALRRVATLVARAAAPEEVFATVTAEVGQVVGAEITSLSRYDPGDAYTRVGSWSGTDGTGLQVGASESLTPSNVATLVYRTARPARVDNPGDPSDPATQLARGLGIRSMVAAPVSIQGRLWGVMMVGSRQEEPLPPETEARLAGFTELVATAIANAETRTALAASRARIVTAGDTARRRIERDLHDGAQQQLASLILRFRGAVREEMLSDAGELTQQLNDVGADLEDALSELRELARGLHPAALAEGGLPHALATLARRSAIPVRLDVRVGGRLPEPIELGAYYVVAETLTNAAKHAQATVVAVTVTAEQERLRVEIVDDGQGGADLAGGSGLVGLSDRIEALGGQLLVSSPRGLGTTVEALLPLTAPADLTLRGG
jgi:GAF domain-containing protein